MIYINLLPYHLRPIKRTPVPYLLVTLIAVLCVAAMAMNFLGMQAAVRAKRAELQQHKNQLTMLQDIVEESNNLQDQKAELASKIETINDIVSDRIIWSRQLWNLSRLAPNSFWYDGIQVGSRGFTERQERVDPKTKKKEIVQVNVTRHILTVTGYVSTTEETGRGVTPLIEETTRDPEFSSMFALENVERESSQFQGTPVTRFKIEYIIRPVGGKEE